MIPESASVTIGENNTDPTAVVYEIEHAKSQKWDLYIPDNV